MGLLKRKVSLRYMGGKTHEIVDRSQTLPIRRLTESGSPGPIICDAKVSALVHLLELTFCHTGAHLPHKWATSCTTWSSFLRFILNWKILTGSRGSVLPGGMMGYKSISSGTEMGQSAASFPSKRIWNLPFLQLTSTT